MTKDYSCPCCGLPLDTVHRIEELEAQVVSEKESNLQTYKLLIAEQERLSAYMIRVESLSEKLAECQRERDALRKAIKNIDDRLNNGIKYDEELNIYVVVWTDRELEQARIEADKIIKKFRTAATKDIE